jgi:hypothetical protein
MKQWELAIAIAVLAVVAHLALVLMWRLDEFLVEIVIRYLQYPRVIRARPRSVSFAQQLREDPFFRIRRLLFIVGIGVYKVGKRINDRLFIPLNWCYHQLEELAIPVVFIPYALLLMVKPFIYAFGTYTIIVASSKVIDRLPMVQGIELHSADYAAIYIGELAVLVLFGTVMVSVLQGRQQSLESRITALGEHLGQHIESMLPKMCMLQAAEPEIEGTPKATNELQNLSYEITAAIADHSLFREIEFSGALGAIRDSMHAANIALPFYKHARRFYGLVRKRRKSAALTRIFLNVLIGLSIDALAFAAGAGKFTDDAGYLAGSILVVLFALVWSSHYAFSSSE